MKMELKTTLQSLVWPLPGGEYRALKRNLLNGEGKEPLYVWQGTLLRGFQQYQICQAHNIPFSIREVPLLSQEDAVIWVCKDQLRRENIPSEMRKYLIGRQYLAEKALAAVRPVGRGLPTKPRAEGNKQKGLSSQQHRSANFLAEEYGLCYCSVQKYGVFAGAVDRISAIAPNVRRRLLSGEVWLSHDNLVAIAQLEASKIKLVGEFIQKTAQSHLQEADLKRIVGHSYSAKAKTRRNTQTASVKHMPTYDPDTEALSLALTIPSWCSSIKRAQSTSDLGQLSTFARKKLLEGLTSLQAETELALRAAKEAVSL